MPQRILVATDKFKGTLSARTAARAIAHGWKQARPYDDLDILPMSDGGDGFGEVLSSAAGGRPRITATVNAAQQPVHATWWWNAKTKTAIIESAQVIGLAMLPPKRFHPFELDTFGLGKVLEAASKAGARECIIGIGGSATNDGGFGMARSLGWNFLDNRGAPIVRWTGLHSLARVKPPRRRRPLFRRTTVAVDVQNLLLGARGCSRVYGPQKGLQPDDFRLAEACLKQLAVVLKRDLGLAFARTPGAGAAGGLGFGLMSFLSAEPKKGFELFAEHARLAHRIKLADLVITGEGAIDRSTLMGKGVGELARLCRKLDVLCVGIAGVVTEPERAKKLFLRTLALTDITTLENALSDPALWLERLGFRLARLWLD